MFPYTRSYGIHGGYTTTSNQCSSCHTMHDATGVKLLAKMTTTDSCLTCHDGTGGFGVYGTIKARTGAEPSGGHSVLSNQTNIVPGGDPLTGGSRVETGFKGGGGFLGCVDCHSPHGASVVDAYNTDRQRYELYPAGFTERTNLLKQKPNGSDTTTTVYGSAWCSGCHRGRHSEGTVNNHPVDSQTFSVDNVPLAPWPGVVDISCNDSNGNVFVADPGNKKIKKFDSSGTFLLQYTMWNGDMFVEPRGVSVAAGNHLWVGDPRKGVLDLFNQDGGAFGATYPHLRPGWRPSSGDTYDLTASGVGTSLDGTRVAIADTEANVVTVRDGVAPSPASSVIILRPAGKTAPNPYPSSILGEFYGPTDAAIGLNGVTYVVDSMNNRVQRFASNGIVIDSFGSKGSGPGQFERPLSVSIDFSGRVYVADTGNHRIQRFTAAGTYDTSFGSLGTGPGQFRLPSGVAVNNFNGDIYVVDAGNSRVQRLTSAGTFVSQWGNLGAGNGQFVFRPEETGSMNYAYDFPNTNPLLASRQHMKGLVYAGRGYLMPEPRSAAQSGHGPICQQCHGNARDAGALYGGLAMPAITMTVRDGVQNSVASVGERDRANPRFSNFPHETSNSKMVVESGDDLCLNCHSETGLP